MMRCVQFFKRCCNQEPTLDPYRVDLPAALYKKFSKLQWLDGKEHILTISDDKKVGFMFLQESNQVALVIKDFQQDSAVKNIFKTGYFLRSYTTSSDDVLIESDLQQFHQRQNPQVTQNIVQAILNLLKQANLMSPPQSPSLAPLNPL